MRKALILTVLYLFGSEAVAQKSFRHAPTVALDDLQDNEMALNLNIQGAARDAIRLANNDYRVKVGRWDAVEDDEMFKFDRPAGSPPPYRPTSRGGFDDAEDNEMFRFDRPPVGSTPPFNPYGNGGKIGSTPPFNPYGGVKSNFDDENDDELFGVPLGNGGSGIYASGGSARGGVAWGGVGQYSHNIGKNTQLIGGATVSHAPGSKVNIAPHVGVKFSFDDENDAELFGVPLGNGGSGLYASGGSARGGVAWGGVGQYSHNIGKNTQLIGGATVSHAPGSKVNIAPHVGVKFSFDDENDNELFAEDDELFGVPLGNGGSGIDASGGSARGGVAWGGVGQYSHNIGKNTQLVGGATVSHAPGSKVNIAPHVGVKFSFDDENDSELFGVPLGNGGSGLYASGGSARGGVAWGGVGQYSHNIGKNTQLVGGATVSHAPGSKVNIAPHVGVKFNFDDAEEN